MCVSAIDIRLLLVHVELPAANADGSHDAQHCGGVAGAEKTVCVEQGVHAPWRPASGHLADRI